MSKIGPRKKLIKKNVIKTYAEHSKDVGSSYVQIAILSNRIKDITKHLETNKKDNSCKMGLKKLIGKRHSLVKYIKGENKEKFESFAKNLRQDLEIKI